MSHGSYRENKIHNLKYGHDRYKEKECPQCGVKHRKEGQFCSNSCSVKSRGAKSPETIEKMRRSGREYYKSPEGLAKIQHKKRQTFAYAHGLELPVSSEEFAVGIPDVRELSDFDIDLNNWDRAERW